MDQLILLTLYGLKLSTAQLRTASLPTATVRFDTGDLKLGYSEKKIYINDLNSIIIWKS